MNCELCAAYHEPRLVKENEHAFAIICKAPLKPEHVLVLPKEHVSSFHDLSPNAAREFLKLIEDMKKIVKEVAQQDVLVVQNSGVHSTEPHIHMHVFPSLGSTRKLVGAYEHIPERENKEMSELATYALRLQEK